MHDKIPGRQTAGFLEKPAALICWEKENIPAANING